MSSPVPAELASSPALRSAAAELDVAAPAARSQRTRLRIALGALLLTLSGGGYWWSLRGIESTDNAQIDADVIAVPARLSGTVARVHFVENQRVAAGALLAELEDAPARAKLAQASANLAAAQAAQTAAAADAALAESNAVGSRAVAAASLQESSAGMRASSDGILEGASQVRSGEAQLAQADLDLARVQELVALGATPKSQLEQAETARALAQSALSGQKARLSSLELSRAQSQSRVAQASAELRKASHVATLVEQAQARLAAAEAQVSVAQAQRDLAALELSYTRIFAPSSGVVSKKSINEGQAVGSGQPIVQLVPEQRWVTANFKETQLGHIRPGLPAAFEVDAYPGVTLHGQVESISGATGARFTLLPPDNATGNFTKVVQRVPVRVRVIDLPKQVVLRPGMSVELKVDTREAG